MKLLNIKKGRIVISHKDNKIYFEEAQGGGVDVLFKILERNHLQGQKLCKNWHLSVVY